jgi:proteasome lid subunit RPN8/RPN11
VREFLKMKLSALDHEVCAAIFLDARDRMIEYRELFRGTIDGATVYPREVVREALALNASALVIAHNHPSGVPEPSEADRSITLKLSKALGSSKCGCSTMWSSRAIASCRSPSAGSSERRHRERFARAGRSRLYARMSSLMVTSGDFPLSRTTFHPAHRSSSRLMSLVVMQATVWNPKEGDDNTSP